MEVHFTPEQEAQLSRIAIAAVREGIAQADRGELIDDDEVRVWLEQQERF
jgi:predicted transcriptional regulator